MIKFNKNDEFLIAFINFNQLIKIITKCPVAPSGGLMAVIITYYHAVEVTT